VIPKLKPVHAWMVIVLLHASQTIYYYPRLTEVVAQHFGGDGRANGWASRDAFFILSWVMLLGLSAIFMLMPRTLRRIPVSMINLPHKDYWLAPERKDESLGFIEREMEWMGVLTIAFLVSVLHLAIRANLNPAHHLENVVFVTLLAGFLVATSGWIILLYRRFPDPTK
jgi:uncharacterized membrane protein